MSDRRRHRDEQPAPAAMTSEESERAVVGHVLANPATFWDVSERVNASQFSVPRLARIWDAMQRCADKGKSPDRRQLGVFIKNDGGEDTPLAIYVGSLIHEAAKGAGNFDLAAYVDTVVALAQKRMLLAALDQARISISAADVGVRFEDMVDEGVRAITSVTGGGFDRDMRTYGEWGDALTTRVADAFKGGEEGGIGLSPGLRAVEEVIGPLIPGKLYVIGGMSSAGKSAITKSIAEAASLDAKRQELGFGYIASLEMNGEEHAARSLSDFLGIPAFKIERATVNQAEVEALVGRGREAMHRYPIVVDQRRRMTMETIRSRMSQVKHTRGLAFGVIDHLLLIRGGRKDSLMDRVMEAVIEAKILAGEFNIPMIMLAQINEKNVLERPSGWPIASDLFGGASITQNADSVSFIHRPEIVTRRREPPKGQSEKHDKWMQQLEHEKDRGFFFSDKGRGVAGGIKRELTFDGPTTTFRDL